MPYSLEIFEYNFCDPMGTLVHIDFYESGASFKRCTFNYNYGSPLGFYHMGTIEIDSCVFNYNQCTYGALFFYDESYPVISNSTFTRNRLIGGGDMSVIECGNIGPVSIMNTVISSTAYGTPVFSPATPTIECCNFYDNDGGDWVDNYEDLLGVNGNISVDPQFCSPYNYDCRLFETSPCLPENNDCNELIGALGQGCTTWLCGDVDSSENVDIDDVVYLIQCIFASGSPPDPLETGDVNCADNIDIDDVVYLIIYIFGGGPEPCFPCPWF